MIMYLKPIYGLKDRWLAYQSADKEPVYIFEEWPATAFEDKSGWFMFVFFLIFALMIAPLFL